jgi:Lhr-like helicase
MEFDSFSEKIREGIAGLGWKEPVAVQQRVIPLMRAGRDLIVQAITGSGKTGAFGLPIVESIDQEKKAIQALALAPTRELAAQVASALRGGRVRAADRSARARRPHHRRDSGPYPRPSEGEANGSAPGSDPHFRRSG